MYKLNTTTMTFDIKILNVHEFWFLLRSRTLWIQKLGFRHVQWTIVQGLPGNVPFWFIVYNSLLSLCNQVERKCQRREKGRGGRKNWGGHIDIECSKAWRPSKQEWGAWKEGRLLDWRYRWVFGALCEIPRAEIEYDIKRQSFLHDLFLTNRNSLELGGRVC